ncbi:conserved hypothetical protein [Crenothrix polyspora]|uniref:Uncharacterized protein n=1 Tax=Crenothrix polyspora TaxID=360316 RepID=A0A1R4H1B8_9GAMM|nr:hypothetical protein [Crenothrix polyspora]SJM90028.1 conserved hypothetical protein [Crenothrix polyspora]
MPTKIVDFSARSKIIHDEPFHVHFWECKPEEYLEFLGNPREFLVSMGIEIPEDCRIETTIENHDWLGKHAPGLVSENGTIICNVGGGNIARSVYRIVSYGHDHSTVGKYKKNLLHSIHEEERHC